VALPPRVPPKGLLTLPTLGIAAAFNVVCVAIVFAVLDQQAKKKYKKGGPLVVKQSGGGGKGKGKGGKGK